MTDGGRAALRLAAELGGTRLSGAGGAGVALVLVERLRAHGLPAVAVLARDPAQLTAPLAAWEASDAPLNLAAILPLPETDLTAALAFHRRRIGALSAALDASLPWLADRPMLAKRLPGRLAGEAGLAPAPLGPLERAELRAFLAHWDDAAFDATFLRPEKLLWPEVDPPPGAMVLVPPLRLAVGSPLLDALRASLRAALRQPIPLLPLPEDPSGLHALKALTPEVAAFRGPEAAWAQAFRALAALPAPPHFCARC